MTKRPTAKSPSTAIARVLKELGLKQGKDFRVRGQYEKGERVGTHVIFYTRFAERVAVDNADRIETKVQQDGGFVFHVSIHYFSTGRSWAWVANYGPRTRETAPVAAEDTAALDAAADATPTDQLDAVGLAAQQWPKGTRVSGQDSQGIERTGTVNGVDVGKVTNSAHPNYGRVYVGVNWDADDKPELGYVIRNRPFVDTLTRI